MLIIRLEELMALDRERVYSPAEICKMFNISKTTLFRWEQEDWFPRVGRSLGGERQYTWEHIQAISKRRVKEHFDGAASTEDEARLREISEIISLHKFIYMGDRTGLQELAEYPGLGREIIQQLLRAALEQYEPGDETFCQILRVVLEQSCRR